MARFFGSDQTNGPRAVYAAQLDIAELAEFTVCGFFKTSSSNPNRGYMYSDMITDGNAKLFIEMGDSSGDAHRFRVFTNTTGTSCQANTGSPGISVDTWYFWALVKDGADALATASYTFYIGEVGSGSVSSLAFSAETQGTGSLAAASTETCIGNRTDGDRTVDADLAYVTVHNTALSVSQMEDFLGGDISVSSGTIIGQPDFTLSGDGDDSVGTLGSVVFEGSPTPPATNDPNLDPFTLPVTTGYYTLTGFSAAVPGDPNPWSPSDLVGTDQLAWWDASDASTITDASGVCSSWTDRFLNGHDLAQSTATFRPTIGSDVITFDGSDNVMTTGDFIYDADGVMIFAVFTAPDSQGDVRFIAEGNTGTNTPLYSPFASGSNPDEDQIKTFIRYDNNATDYASGANFGAGTFNNTQQLSMVGDTGSVLSTRLDGTADATTYSYTRSTSTFNVMSMGALVRTTNVAHMNISVNEVVVTATLSDEDRDRVEGYLAWKWGLEGNLDASHPYKSAAPLVEPDAAISAATGYYSLTGQAANLITPDTILVQSDFATGNLDVSRTSITGGETSTPTITIFADPGTNVEGGSPTDVFYGFSGRIIGIDTKTPTFEMAMDDPLRAFGDPPSSYRPWYTYDDPDSLTATWERFDNGSTTSSILSFSNNSGFTQNTVYIAHRPRYSTIKSRAFLDSISGNALVTMPPSSTGNDFVHFNTTATTKVDGVTALPSIDLLSYRITDPSTLPMDGSAKRVAVMVTGTHAGEDQGEYGLQNLVEYLLSGVPTALDLLRNFDFYFYPIVNSTGRDGGAYRGTLQSGQEGEDPNREWAAGSLLLEEVEAVRDAVTADTGDNIDVFMDWHGRGADNPPAIFAHPERIDQRFVANAQSYMGSIANVTSSESSGISTVYYRANTNVKLATTIEGDGIITDISEYETFGEAIAQALSDSYDNSDLQKMVSGSYSLTGSDAGLGVVILEDFEGNNTDPASSTITGSTSAPEIELVTYKSGDSVLWRYLYARVSGLSGKTLEVTVDSTDMSYDFIADQPLWWRPVGGTFDEGVGGWQKFESINVTSGVLVATQTTPFTDNEIEISEQPGILPSELAALFAERIANSSQVTSIVPGEPATGRFALLSATTGHAGVTIPALYQHAIKIGNGPRKIICIIRQHPNELIGEQAAVGLINRLSDGSPEMASHLTSFQYHFIQANPQGVYGGNQDAATWQSDQPRINMNREWDSALLTSVNNIKTYLSGTVGHSDWAFLLDFHNRLSGTTGQESSLFFIDSRPLLQKFFDEFNIAYTGTDFVEFAGSTDVGICPNYYYSLLAAPGLTVEQAQATDPTFNAYRDCGLACLDALSAMVTDDDFPLLGVIHSGASMGMLGL